MNVKQVAERLEVSDKLVYQLVAEGRIKCVRIGRAGKRGAIVIWEKHLREFVETLEKDSARQYGQASPPRRATKDRGARDGQ